MLVIMESKMTYKFYTKLYKCRWVGKVLDGDCVQSFVQKFKS